MENQIRLYLNIVTNENEMGIITHLRAPVKTNP
jgi:hypothetical protein